MQSQLTIQRCVFIPWLLTACLSLAGCQRTKPVEPGQPTATAAEPATADDSSTSPPNTITDADNASEETDPDKEHDSSKVAQDSNTDASSEDSQATANPDNGNVGSPPNIIEKSPDPERIIVLAETGPVIIDLFIEIDDHSFRQATNALIDDVLTTGDTNQDGQTAWKELLSSDRFAYGQYGNPRVDSEQQRVELAKTYDINSNKYVDREEVLGFLRQDASNSESFSLTESDAQADSITTSPVFRWLDTNGDELLDLAERKSAVSRIWKNDAEDDRIIRAGDFNPNPNGNMAMRRRRRTRLPRKTIVLRKYSNWSKILYSVEERYAYGNPITLHDIPDFAELFNQLDADQDEFLSPREFSAVADVPPHVSMTLRYGADVAGHISVDHVDPDLALTSMSVGDNRAKMAIAGSLLELAVREPNVEVAVDQQLDMAFQQFDTNKDGTFSMQEYESLQELTATPFAVTDSNGDDTVDRDELAANIQVQQAAQQYQISGRVGASQQPLFGQLDINGDGQLTVREVDLIPERLLLLDENGDGVVTASERPNSISIQLTRGVAPGRPTVAMQDTPTSPVDQSGPAWFRSMDLNRDGEISRREFIGPIESFETLDQNADQFISLSEATGSH